MTAFDRISVELTNRCSKACWFCYNASDPGQASSWQPDEVVGFVRDCSQHGIKAVSFGGGEPLEYEGVFEVLAALRGRVFRSVTTSGLALDANLAAIARAAPDKIHISIHVPGNAPEVTRVIRQVHAVDALGIASGINLLVRASQLEDAIRCAAAIRAAGITNERIVYLPMRGQDTPTADDLGRVAGIQRFQSMSCLMACAASPRFVSVSWDKHVAWCSYTRSRRPLAAPSHAALIAATERLGLEYCDGPRDASVARRRLALVR